MSRKVLSKRYRTEQLERKGKMARPRPRPARLDSDADVLMTSFTNARNIEDDVEVLASLPGSLDRSVIDLTSPGPVLRPGSITPPMHNDIVDLTQPSPVVIESVRTRRRRQRNNDHVMLPSQRDNILVLGDSDDENEVQVLPPSSPRNTRSTHPHLTDSTATTTNSSSSTSSSSSSAPPTSDNLATDKTRVITCPVCMEDEPTITAEGSHLASTTCGHIFCNACIRSAINTQHKCPTCRKKLTIRQIHPIFL